VPVIVVGDYAAAEFCEHFGAAEDLGFDVGVDRVAYASASAFASAIVAQTAPAGHADVRGNPVANPTVVQTSYSALLPCQTVAAPAIPKRGGDQTGCLRPARAASSGPIRLTWCSAKRRGCLRELNDAGSRTSRRRYCLPSAATAPE